MSDRVGRMRIGVPEEERFLGRDWQAQAEISTALLEDVDAEIRRLIDQAEEAASAYLRAHRKVLDALALRLVEEETLRGEELEAILGALNGSTNRSRGDLSPTGTRRTRR